MDMFKIVLSCAKLFLFAVAVLWIFVRLPIDETVKIAAFFVAFNLLLAIAGFIAEYIALGITSPLRNILVGKRIAQLVYITTYKLPERIGKKVKQQYPHLTQENVDQVLDGLMTYFEYCNLAGKRTVAMPSQVVDVAWHEFILFTRDYQSFCRKAFGRFLHHTPTEAMGSPTLAADGIKRAWRISCANEEIDPRSPERLPLLFGMDRELRIDDGFIYALDCKDEALKDNASPIYGHLLYCAGDIGCASGCMGTCGDGSVNGGESGCGDGDGGGCGGGGCSGGGCGGGDGG